VVAFALGLPLNLRRDYTHSKVALKRALKNVLPADILKRPKKGFQVPLADWFRGSLKQYWSDHCLDPQSPLADYVYPDRIRKMRDENARGADYGNRMWMLLALSVWLESVQ